MKAIEKEETCVKKYTVWQATDGTEFVTKEECQKYEQSACGVMRGRVSKLIASKKHDAWTLLGGYDDHSVVAYKPQSKEDADTIMQLMLLENPWLNDDGRKELREERYNIIYNAYKNNDVVLFGQNCENEYYFINSRQNIIDNLMALDKKVEETNE